MKKLSLNEHLGEVDLSKTFVFSFDYFPLEKEGLDSTDFELKLIIGDNALKITNVLPSKGYISKVSDDYIIKKLRKDIKKVSFFGDELFINEDKIVKKVDGRYTLTNEYELIKEGDTSSIKRFNSKNDEGYYVRPVEVKLFQNGVAVRNSREYFYSSDSPFDASKPQSYQLIVSNNAREVTIRAKKDEIFKKIKTLSFSQGVERGEIALEIDANMDLRNLQFSFFELNVE